jgi:hypothetical protein
MSNEHRQPALGRLSLAKILYGANAFEINDIQEQETETSRVRQLRQCYIASELAAVVRQFVVPDMKRISFCLAQALRFGITG